MRGQRTACRSAPFEGLHRNLLVRRRRSRHPCRRFGLRSILFQVGELKLELLEQRATLRGLAEPLVLLQPAFSGWDIRPPSRVSERS
jgi:hypothetical protein